MESTGNNRYELLFMDDDVSIPADIPIANKKKQTSVANTSSVAAPKKPKATVAVKSTAVKTNAGNNSAGKENKPALSNKDEGNKKSEKGGSGKKDVGAGQEQRNIRQRNKDGVIFNAEKGEGVREQRNFRERRNFNGYQGAGSRNEEFRSDQRPVRQFNRDRESRGPPRKREFDRQSGSDKTGVKAIDKRDGAGAHNWGSVKQEIEDINKSNTGVDVSRDDGEKEELPNEQSAEQGVSADEEAAAKEMTLDEWKAMRQQRSKPQYNLRKAGEGEDTSQWKKMIVLNKKKEGETEEELEYDPSLYPQRVGRLQRIVDIQFNFNDSRRGGFGRGRGPRRGNDKNRFDDRPQRNFGEKSHQQYQQRKGTYAPKVDDERQFPTLS